ncbi:E3 ubiquitin-protein ligase RNF13 isoform X1 [Falco biarmicus]|uniref:E3 ubiquitin-protein ligase RNF13 isoform X1 n=1 Tax=Falco rusticolus TaxID=120794 RepID=UPI0006785EC0|nr:E3 ubiquitin-protein ligase RNF13 isoform X1 [Falco rusticolus]XP_040468516.1 E3 ubiquitin-protein ligase RNF13 isoform X1 [Falco naumanni]XP_055579483.1 E3 ubiquitin-protein ligase RNF13 isoform X1 [Falco cherrug]XP_055673016.1 E3 ubiquitin-protein ligase RNF13 isoform X1 [Falco peregrinus]XP_056214366.1 E3 ubiquitin-protein ligase RNF13 isoform X1 [Falco biarmicus]
MLLSIGMLMLSATQIYTILTVQLFAFLNLLPVEADILAYNLENGTQTFDDLPARFGYRLPAEGLKGFLINSKPENACEPIAPPPLKDNSSSAFIVLIRRLECNFDIKVLNAQRAGYKAAIVHNVDSDDLISMGSNDIEVLKKIDIPSVFIGETSANSLKEEFTYEKGGHVVLIPEFSLPLEYYLIPFLIIVGICLILIVIFMSSSGQNIHHTLDMHMSITKFVQDRHRARRNRLRKDQLKKLSVHKFKKGDEYDVCAICLDEYEDGDKLRILPCSHAYHCKCVDPWLTKTKKTCPVCKQKVVPSQGDSDSETDSSQEENEVSENTPLLRPLASVSTQSFGALSESHSHQNMTESSEYEEDDNENIDSSDAENGINEESVVVQLQPNDEREYRVANTV